MQMGPIKKVYSVKIKSTLFLVFEKSYRLQIDQSHGKNRLSHIMKVLIQVSNIHVD